MTYIVQHGWFWSFTEREFVAWLREALPAIRSGEGYELPDNHMLRQPPSRRVKRDGSSWRATRSDVTLYEPMDWTVAQWEAVAAAAGVG